MVHSRWLQLPDCSYWHHHNMLMGSFATVLTPRSSLLGPQHKDTLIAAVLHAGAAGQAGHLEDAEAELRSTLDVSVALLRLRLGLRQLS